MKVYNLGSSPLVFAPGVVKWAIYHYQFARDRKVMVKAISEGWNIPKDAAVALLSKKVPHEVKDDVVSFSA